MVRYALRFTALGYLAALLVVPVGLVVYRAFEDGIGALRLHAVAQRRADAFHEFAHAEGLRHIIVRPEVEGLHLAPFVAPAGEHYDRRPGARAPHPADHLQPVHVGEPQVEQNHLGRIVAEAVDRSLTRTGFQNAVALRREAGAQYRCGPD